MDEIIAQMMEWGAKYVGGGAFFGMALISCVFLYITSQKDRKRIVSRRLTPFIAAPCKTWQAPWYMEWADGELPLGNVPFPNR